VDEPAELTSSGSLVQFFSRNEMRTGRAIKLLIISINCVLFFLHVVGLSLLVCEQRIYLYACNSSRGVDQEPLRENPSYIRVAGMRRRVHVHRQG